MDKRIDDKALRATGKALKSKEHKKAAFYSCLYNVGIVGLFGQFNPLTFEVSKAER